MNKLVDAYYETFADEPPPVLDDPGNAILDLDVRLSLLEAQVAQMAVNTLTMAQHIRDLRAQSTAASQSAIIMPDRFN